MTSDRKEAAIVEPSVARASRRAFLTGRTADEPAWQVFCRRLGRAAQGELIDFGIHDGYGSARLEPRDEADVKAARRLCAEYGVVLALSGVNPAGSPPGHSVLWLEPEVSLTACTRLQGAGDKWFVQPGCLLGALSAAGLTQFDDQPAYLSVAAWLADRARCAWLAGHTRSSGLLHASVLLADGVETVLGPFGPQRKQGLDTLAMQKLVPALFQLAVQEGTHLNQGRADWPARYRLDALQPAQRAEVNLAHLLLGHGGTLAWVNWLVFEPCPAGTLAPYPPQEPQVREIAQALDARVKALFDPAGLWPPDGLL